MKGVCPLGAGSDLTPRPSGRLAVYIRLKSSRPGWLGGGLGAGWRARRSERERKGRETWPRPTLIAFGPLSLSLWGVCATPPPAHFLLPSLILTHRTGATRPADRQARADDILCLEGRGGVRNRGEEEKKGVVRPGEHTLAFRLSPSLSSVHGRLPDQARPPSHPGALSLIAVHAGRVPRVASLGPRTRP